MLLWYMQADLWSVGAILFQLVTGKPPFDGTSQYQVFGRINMEINMREMLRFAINYEAYVFKDS